MGLRIGFSLWREDLRRLDKIFKEILEAGMDHVEVSVESPLDLEEAARLCDAARRSGLSLGIHAPWREIFLASPVEEIRGAGLRATRSVVERLSSFEPDYFVVHGSSDQIACSSHEDLCLESLQRSLEELSTHGRTILLETTQGGCCGKTGQILKLADKIPGLQLCIDLAHVAVENIVKAKSAWPRSISEAVQEVPEVLWRRARLIHVHGLRDRERRPRSHHDFARTPLGAEDVARTALTKGIEYIVFEVFYRSSGGDEAGPSAVVDEVARLRRWADLMGASLAPH